MSTGQTIKCLFSQEMSSIPEGRRRRKRRGHESNLSRDSPDKCIVLADMCRYPSVLMVGKSERTGALVTCNNRYTVNLVIYLSWRKEADAQYLEAQTAGRLMFKANTPLTGVYSSLLHVFPTVHQFNQYLQHGQLSVKSFSWPFILPWQPTCKQTSGSPTGQAGRKSVWTSLESVFSPSVFPVLLVSPALSELRTGKMVLGLSTNGSCTHTCWSSHIYCYPPVSIKLAFFPCTLLIAQAA